MKNIRLIEKGEALLLIVSILILMMIATTAYALTDTTNPKIISLSVVNNEQDISRSEEVSVVFSEDMDPTTINEDTFKIMQRTTPSSGEYRSKEVSGILSYDDRTATFNPYEILAPNQMYGNVFTVMVTTGAKDLAGNGLSEDYIWSFTTGEDIFNTGPTTSQQDQNTSPIVVPATPLTQTPETAATNTNLTAANAFPWLWVIGIIAAILLMLLIVVSMNPSKQKKVKTKNITTPVSVKKLMDPEKVFGYTYPVKDIEGIGPTYGDALMSMGIKDTEQLWKANPAKIVDITGASIVQVISWQNMAELASVKDIGPQYAELLERSGIHSIEQLKNYDAKKLLKLIDAKQDTLKINIQGNHPKNVMVEHWIDSARHHESQKAQT
jgi:predicted flap endonuclease-1-like 5' DNA nuclease